MLGKQAKVLNESQIRSVLNHLSKTRNSARNRVMFLLSLHGLRAKEIASLEASMVKDASGNIADFIALEDKASKGVSGRLIYLNKNLKQELEDLLAAEDNQSRRYVISTERSEKFSPNAVAVFFKRLYTDLGMSGASSHSGRRTFITNAAKKISLVGGSLRDVMQLAGHKNLATTQRYIEQDSEAQKKVTQMLYASVTR